MKKLLKEFEHNGEKYEIMLVKRPDGMYFLKDFNGEAPFSPFYYCVSDLGFIDIDEIDARLDQPMLKYLIAQSEDGARYWADHKDKILEFMPN
jgi:hypothetical protein